MTKAAPKGKKKVTPAEEQPQQSASEGPSSGAPDGQSVDRIRDIIFGAQMRDYEERFQKLEKKLLQEAQDLRGDVKDRFEELNSALNKEISGLSKHLKDEQGKRSKADAEAARQLRDVQEALQAKLESQGGQTNQLLDQLGQRISKETDRLRADLKSTADKLLNHIEDLRLAKTDRGALASLLDKMAENLRTDPKGKQ